MTFKVIEGHQKSVKQETYVVHYNCVLHDAHIGRDVFFTARCTLVQSAVLRSHVVCLSVRPAVRLLRWRIVIT